MARKPLTEEQKARNRITAAAWRANNKERIAARYKEWAERNADHLREYEKAKYAANKTSVKAKSRRWALTNPERKRLNQNSAYARKTARGIMTATKRGAKSRNLEFNLPLAWVESKLLANVCELTGIPFVRGVHTGRKAINPFNPSVDRIESTEGYNEKNCRMVLTCVNYGLGAWGTRTIFPVWAAAIKKHMASP